MRKPRFLCIVPLLILLLFALALSACQTAEPPPEEPPIEEPPAEEPPAEKPPLVIEQGEILVSDYWQNDPAATNPRPELAEGTPLCFEQIAYVNAYYQHHDLSTKLYVADDLAEASAIVEKYVSTRSLNTVCDTVSHVDFSTFRLLAFVEYYGSGSLTHAYELQALLHDGQGQLTRMMFNKKEGDSWITADIDYMVRFVLVRRSDYEAPTKSITTQSCYYTYPPNEIEQSNILVSDYWDGREANDGYWLNFEELGIFPLDYGAYNGMVYAAHDLDDAAEVIDSMTYYQSDACLALNEMASHVDFSQFCLLLICEEYALQKHAARVSLERLGVEDSKYLEAHYRYTGEENVRVEYGRYGFLRTILVRRDAIDAFVERFSLKRYFFPAETE